MKRTIAEIVATWIVSLACTYERARDRGIDEGIEYAEAHIKAELL
tara:strand:+ start:1558 stop:1692 length:135 start_codon:yes stop_codon:yes gene_type:complete